MENEFGLFPEGVTDMSIDEEEASVSFFFADAQDAIIFFQFWQAFANGEYSLYIEET